MKELKIGSPMELMRITDKYNFIKSIDLETTGLSPTEERVIEYGSYMTDFYGNELGTVQTLINPERALPEKITEITGLTDLDLFGKPKFSEVAVNILYDMCQGSERTLLLAHNAKFDFGFLTSEFMRLGLDLDTIDITYLCTKNLSKTFVQLGLFDNKGSNSLQHLMEVFGIEDPNHHRSINDCIMCNRLFRKLREIS